MLGFRFHEKREVPQGRKEVNLPVLSRFNLSIFVYLRGLLFAGCKVKLPVHVAMVRLSFSVKYFDTGPDGRPALFKSLER